MEESKWFTDGTCDILGGAEKTEFIQSGEEEVKGRLLWFAMELISACR